MTGPYLLFARSHPAFSEYHGFEDWSFLGRSMSGKMWGKNAVVAAMNAPADFSGAGEVPEWVEFIEVASISPDCASAPFSDPASEYDDDGTKVWSSSARNISDHIKPRGTSEKATFDRRLLLVSYYDDDRAQFIARHNERVKAALGRTSACVWHSEDLFAFAFCDGRAPQDILNGLGKIINEGSVYDAALFRIAAAIPEQGVPSPLAHFLSRPSR